MGVVKVLLSDHTGTPVHFHTSADITYFDKRLLRGTKAFGGWDIGSINGWSTETVIVELNNRINYMIECNEDLQKQVNSARKDMQDISNSLNASTVMTTQSSFIKPEYFEPENYEATEKDAPPYTATIKVPAVRSTDVVIINPVQHADVTRAQAQLESYNCISNLIVGDGVITFKCYEMKPITGIPIQIVILRGVGDNRKED